MSNKEKIALAKSLDEEIDLLNKKYTAVKHYRGALQFKIVDENNPIIVSDNAVGAKPPWYFNEIELERLHFLMGETKEKYLSIIKGAIQRKEKELNEMFK